MKENDLGRECRTYGRDYRYVLGFGEEPEGKRPHGRHSCNVRIILKWIF